MIMRISIEGWEENQLVKGWLDGPDRAQTQAAELLTVELQAGQTVTIKQNPTALKGQRVRVGACAWDGALVLSAYLNAQPSGSFEGLRCVELGAGVGLAGLVLAKLGARVVLTDQPQCIAFANMNIAKNWLRPNMPRKTQEHQHAIGQAEAVPLQWGAPGYLDVVAALSKEPVDVVIATDCIYPDPDGSVPSSEHFMTACAGLCNYSTRVLVTFEARSDELRSALLAAAHAKFSRIQRIPKSDLPVPYRTEHIEMYEMQL
eukprot:jgi/Chrzof1/5424/Cz16g02150.t1